MNCDPQFDPHILRQVIVICSKNVCGRHDTFRNWKAELEAGWSSQRHIENLILTNYSKLQNRNVIGVRDVFAKFDVIYDKQFAKCV